MNKATKRISGNLNRVIAAYVVAMSVRQAVIQAEAETHRKHPHHVDVLEGYAGAANITKLSWQFDLTALAPVDKEMGWDLMKEKGRASWWKTLTTCRPLVTILGHPCTLYCFYNVHCNYADRPEVLEKLRKEQEPLWEITAGTCEFQSKTGAIFLLENPLGSELHNDAKMNRIKALPGVTCGISHGCENGVKSSDGKPIFKPQKWWTNEPRLLEYLCADRCGKTHTKEEHVTAQGKETKHTQVYPEKMCRNLLRAIREHAQRLYPNRFAPGQSRSDKIRRCLASGWVRSSAEGEWQSPMLESHATFYVEARPPKFWERILEDVDIFLNSNATRQHILAPGEAMYKDISVGLPGWRLEKVQLGRVPKARRSPMDVPWTHRACALLLNSGKVLVETEALERVKEMA